MKQIKELYKDQVAVIFRNFPLTTIHPNALAASTAAEAAGLQGKFWEMHDKLYENQQAWSTIDPSKRTDLFVGYAEDIGLKTDQFKTDLSDPKVTEKINRDRAFAKRLGVSGTPSFYLNGTVLDQGLTNDLVQGPGTKVMDKLDSELKKVGIEPPKRTE